MAVNLTIITSFQQNKMKLTDIKGIGAQMEKKLCALGIDTIGNLLSFIPSKYVDLGLPTSVLEAEEGQFCLFEGEVVRQKENSGRKKAFTITFKDTISRKNTYFNCIFYNQPYLKTEFEIGRKFRLFSKITDSSVSLLVNPTIEPLDKLKLLTKGIYTVYPLKGEIGQRTFKKLVYECFALLGYKPTVSGICQRDDTPLEKAITSGFVGENLSNSEFALFDTLYKIHFPKDEKECKEAIETLSAIDFAMGLKTYKKSRISAEKSRKEQYLPQKDVKADFTNCIDFSLTDSQLKAICSIEKDLESNKYMSRIVSGDVGSGKSVVAFFALTFGAYHGKQTAYMCPTEILATQQFNSYKRIADKLGIKCALLTSSTKSAERKEILNGLKDGTVQVIFGTHSLVSKDVVYNHLSIAAIDEQHRFGVSARAELENKGATDVLTLTATPIPRTLALTLYEDIDVSSIYKRENAKTSIATKIVPDHKLDDLICYINKECAGGKQAFIVCPTIKDSEGIDLYSVDKFCNDYFDKFGNLTTSILHGKMSAAEKSSSMEQFASGKTDLLVATSLVEVGIDTKASIIAILNSDRFGLASLHQLRGRVGRDGKEAYCFLHIKTAGATALERLLALENIDDGLMLAEKDLEMRGSGDFLGTRQKGVTLSPYFNLPSTIKGLMQAKELANDQSYDDLTVLMQDLFGADYSNFEDKLKTVTLNS